MDRKKTTPATRKSGAKPWQKGVSKADRARALDLFKKGNYHFERTQHTEALGFYRKAVKFWDHPAIRFNMAMCLMHLNQPVEAYQSFVRALRFGREPLGHHFDQARKYRKVLLKTLAILKVSCDEPGAEVSLDGKPMFKAPGEKETVVTPGRHQLVASKAGFMTTTKNLTLASGKSKSVELELIPEVGYRTKSRYHWAIPTGVTAGAGVVLAVGLALFVKGRLDIEDMKEDVKRHIAEYGMTVPYTYNTYREKQAQNLQYAGEALLGVAAAAAATSVVLWLIRKKRVRYRRAVRVSQNGSGIGIVF